MEFLVGEIAGSENFEVNEESNDHEVVITITATQSVVGLIIGKQGKTIKNLRKIASIKGVLDKKTVRLNVVEK